MKYITNMADSLNGKDTLFYPTFVSTEFALLISAAVVSSVIAGYRLFQPGVSSDVRKLISVRHVIFIFTFTICNVYYFLQRAA